MHSTDLRLVQAIQLQPLVEMAFSLVDLDANNACLVYGPFDLRLLGGTAGIRHAT
jgi:hypothetical protein